MTRFWTAIFGVLVLALSFYGIETHSYYINVLFDTDMRSSVIRIALAIGLLGYAFLPSVRTLLAQDFLSTSGFVLILFAGISLISPSLMGYLNEYISLGDTLIFFESGIIARVMSRELPSYKPQPLTRVLNTYDSAPAS